MPSAFFPLLPKAPKFYEMVKVTNYPGLPWTEGVSGMWDFSVSKLGQSRKTGDLLVTLRDFYGCEIGLLCPIWDFYVIVK